VLLITGFILSSSAQRISGVAHLRLNSPATEQLREEIKSIAVDSLKNAASQWLHRTYGYLPDSTNALEWHHFRSFVRSCAKAAKSESYVEAREWTLRFDLTPEQINSVLLAHNARIDSQTVKYWSLAQEGIKHSRSTVVFTSCVHALYYINGHFGTPFTIKSDTESLDLKTVIRQALQDAVDRLQIRYSNFIVKGKPGTAPENDITITALIDSIPLAGLPFTASLPDKEKLFERKTLSDGTTQIGEFTIPFVPYGTFLHIKPNLGAIIRPTYSFDLADFGLTPGEGHNQTLIFNIVKQTYSLDYKVSAVNQVVVPVDFTSGNLVRRFLEDSCSMTPVSASSPSDLKITVHAQVSSYTFDDREQTEMKAEALARVQPEDKSKAQVEKTAILHQKTFDSNHEIPTGLFFWETTSSLRKLLRDMLNSL
jgi:hypothetical protein